MNWEKSLDKYLTTEPDDGFNGWCESVDDCFSNLFWDKNEKWITKYDGLCNKWLNNLFRKGKLPNEAAQIIEKAFKIYNYRK